MKETYGVRRLIKSGNRYFAKYFTGSYENMITYSMLDDWTDSPSDSAITVLDKIEASQALEYIQRLTNDPDVTLDVIKLAPAYKLDMLMLEMSEI